MDKRLLALPPNRDTLMKGRVSTFSLLLLISLDQLLLIKQTLFTKKQATLMRRSTVLSLPLQLVFPAANIKQGRK